MPSKRNTILALVAVVLLIWGGSQVDWTRNVPHYPPDFAVVYGVDLGTGMPAALAQVPRPNQPKPNQPKPPTRQPEVVPEDPEPGEGGETRITWLTLQPVTAQHAPQVEDTGDMNLAIVSVYGDGKLRWGGHSGISYATIADMCQKNAANAKFKLIIAPDHKAPWKYVYWAIEAARENGVTNIGIGATPIYDDKKNLLVELKAPQPTEAYVENPDSPEIKVNIEEDKTGNIEYSIGPQAGTGLQALFGAVGAMNTEYAEFISGDYSRNVNTTPWVLVASPDTNSGAVIRTLDAIRAAAVYTVRFGGEFPDRPR